MENSLIKISVVTPTIRPQYLNLTYECLKKQTFKNFEWLVDIDFPSDKFLLPKAMNRLIKRSQGEIIVHLQDCIEIPENFLEHIYNSYNGDFVTYPVGKREGEDVKWDWRKSSLRQQKDYLNPHEWEADLAVTPRKAFFDIGGYDEAYCDGWSWDNVEVAYRASACGYKFRCDNAVAGIAIDHDKEIKHPFRNVLRNNDWRARETEMLCRIGDYKKDYLSE